MSVMDGILSINKPVGITSYDVIRKVKKLLREQEPPSHKAKAVKVGHAGTLDPFADGVLLILVGKATKRFDEIQGWQKTYRAVAKLGARSDTLDCTGVIENRKSNIEHRMNKNDIQKVAVNFVGEIEQVVPSYAAAKYRGRKLYEYAREGVEIPEKKKQVTVYSIKVLRVLKGEVEMRVVCASGTYIRQLSYEIIKDLGVESYLSELTREAVGEYTIGHSYDLEQVDVTMFRNMVTK